MPAYLLIGIILVCVLAAAAVCRLIYYLAVVRPEKRAIIQACTKYLNMNTKLLSQDVDITASEENDVSEDDALFGSQVVFDSPSDFKLCGKKASVRMSASCSRDENEESSAGPSRIEFHLAKENGRWVVSDCDCKTEG